MMEDIKYRKRPDIVVQNVGSEVLLLDMNGNKLHQLNTTASMLWEAIDGVRSVSDLATILVEAFDIEKERALDDVSQTMKVLREAGLVDSVDSPDGSTLEAQDDLS